MAARCKRIESHIRLFSSGLQKYLIFLWGSWIQISHAGLIAAAAKILDDELPSEAEVKQCYISLRPSILARVRNAFVWRRDGGKAFRRSSACAGTRGRAVVWLFGDLCEPLSSLMLAELPIDVTNLLYWTSGTSVFIEYS